MKPYSVQTFRNDLGEVSASRMLAMQTGTTKRVVVNEAAAAISPEPDTIYLCGELTGLTVTEPPAVGAWMIVFISGETPTATTIPASVLGAETFAAAKNTLYEINVLDGRAAIGSWAVTENA